MHYPVFGAWGKIGCFLSAISFGLRGLGLDGGMGGSRSWPLKAFLSSVHTFSVFTWPWWSMTGLLQCIHTKVYECYATNLLRFSYFFLHWCHYDLIPWCPLQTGRHGASWLCNDDILSLAVWLADGGWSWVTCRGTEHGSCSLLGMPNLSWKLWICVKWGLEVPACGEECRMLGRPCCTIIIFFLSLVFSSFLFIMPASFS